MGLPFNRGQIGQALANFVGLKGGFQPVIEPTVNPVVNIGDLVDTPYLQYGTLVGSNGFQAATAAKYSYVIVQPGDQVALQIYQVIVENRGAAAQPITIRRQTATNVGQLDALAAKSQLRELSSTITGQNRSSFLRAANDASPSIGDAFINASVPAGNTLIWDAPRPGVILYGNDEGGVPALAVAGVNVNEDLIVSYFGREWPLPG